MKIICLCFISFALSSVALTDGRFHKSKQDQSAVYKDEMEKELWQVMSAENEEYIDDDEDETKVYSFHPTKHPYKQCIENYQVCAQDSCKRWEKQKECFLQFYRCQNEYTAKCRELYRNKACYNILGKDECWKKLRACYGSS